MALQLSLNERYQQILKATVRHYIATVEPVGSKTLAQEYDFSVSSATIRNALGRLEKAGLLYQPHPSAGRIPSDRGYRIYVDQLITPDETIGPQIEKIFDQQLQRDTWSFEAILQRAAQILATLSGYIALITLPQTANQIRHLQLVPVSADQVMLIIVTDAYQTHSLLINFPSSDDDEQVVEGELQILSNFLNSKLRGRTLAELVTLDWVELDREFERYADFLKTLLTELSLRLQPASSTPILIQGISTALHQPEFSQLEQVQMLLHLLEVEQEQLLPLIFDLPESSASRVKITIGAENPLESMRPCTLVSCTYRQGEVPVGSVGIIGPTRMLYESAIPLVETTADYLSEAFS
ncbi:MAG: heat-inducible transcriptional repressor HrcA [Cyanophyceae cyanobacterium]